jgi:hypothetical protein
LQAAVKAVKVAVVERVALGHGALVDSSPDVLGVTLDGLDVLPIFPESICPRVELQGIRVGAVGLALHVSSTSSTEHVEARGSFPCESAPILFNERFGKSYRPHGSRSVPPLVRAVYS